MSENWEQWVKKFSDIGYQLDKTKSGFASDLGKYCRYLARSTDRDPMSVKMNHQVPVRDFEDTDLAIQEQKLGELYAQC